MPRNYGGTTSRVGTGLASVLGCRASGDSYFGRAMQIVARNHRTLANDLRPPMIERDPLSQSGPPELDALFDLTPMLVRIVDLGGRVRRANVHAVAEYAETAPDTLRALWERRAPRVPNCSDAIAFVQSPGMRALGGATVRGELVCVRRADGGERFLESSAAPLFDAAQRVTGAVLLDLDVTERCRLERLAREQAQAMEVLAARQSPGEDVSASAHDRTFAAIAHVTSKVLHDVNNALNPIMSATYLLEHHAESPDTVRQYATLIRLATEAGSAIASRLGRFVRQEPLHEGGGELIHVSELIDGIVERALPMSGRQTADHSGVVLQRHDRASLTVRGLDEDLRYALSCVVQNALEAMLAGGTLRIEVDRDGDFATIAVGDSGAGMSDTVRARAFEPFFSTKNVPGAGLSLAEAYSVAKRHGGAMSIASASGAGTTVTMRLPTAAGAMSLSRPASTVVSLPLTILIVEDHDDGRDFLRRVLLSNGHRVDAVASCAEAREKLAAASTPIYNLLLTDVSLPDGSGWELLAFARRHYPALRVGVVTGWEPSAGSEEAIGAEFILKKPLRATELLQRVEGRSTTQALE